MGYLCGSEIGCLSHFCDAKIYDLHKIVLIELARQNDIAWLEISMDDALRMRMLHGLAHLNNNSHQPLRRNAPVVLQCLRQILSLNQIHYRVRAAVGRYAAIVRGDDVLLSELSDVAQLTLKTFGSVLILDQMSVEHFGG